MATLRAFIAVGPEPESPARRWLVAFLLALESRHPRVRWVKPDHLHLTLKFLGNIPQERVEQIGGVLDSAARHGQPLRLELGAPGHFGSGRTPRTFWIGFRPGPGLKVLHRVQAELEAGLQGLGFPREERPWTPHITLGRNPREAGVDGWERLLPAWAGQGAPAFDVKDLHFYSSELTPDGPIHRALRDGSLGGSKVERPAEGPKP
jgi:2'-5' RNA ligase